MYSKVQRGSVALLCSRVDMAMLTDTGPHVHGRHEPIEAEAAVLPGDVGALAPVTDVRVILALIDVCGTK